VFEVFLKRVDIGLSGCSEVVFVCELKMGHFGAVMSLYDSFV
jgi:hypothetical protein